MSSCSDNVAATEVDDIVDDSRLARLARRVGMRGFVPVAFPWGESRVAPRGWRLYFKAVGAPAPG